MTESAIIEAILRAKAHAHERAIVEIRSRLVAMRLSSPERAAEIAPYIEHADRLLARDYAKEK